MARKRVVSMSVRKDTARYHRRVKPARPAQLGARQRGQLAQAVFELLAGSARATATLARATRDAGPTAVEEALLMMVLYAGFPAAIEAFRLWRERGGGGEGPLRRIRSARTGGATFVAIYGSRAGRVRKVMRALSPELEALMMDVGYGRVLSRPGLDLASRELVTVAALVAGTWPRQLRSHLEGAERAGVPRRELRARLQKWLNTMSSGDQGRILAELGMWDPGFPQRGGSQ